MASFRTDRPWKNRQDNPEVSKELIEKTGLSPLTLRVLMSRGLSEPQAIENFIKPSLTQLTDPFLIEDMQKAVERLAVAREQKQKVFIYGDYDVDGTCGAALLSWVFQELGFEFKARQPDRFKDGYGVGAKAVEEMKTLGAELLVTVDCGITSFDAAKKAKELGIDLIVVDHHQVDAVKGLPEAYAILNPQKATCPSGLRQLCGCGLAFYLALALRAHGRKLGWFHDASDEPNLKQHLDLVVVATAADQVPLTGDNRVLVQQGLDVLRRTQKPGLKALMEIAGVKSDGVSPGHLGFVLGPRINASGRIQSAESALQLLTTSDAKKGYELAQLLEKLNKERADLQNEIWDQVRAQAEKGIAEGKYKNAVVVADPGWHEGVVGIVASRVTEIFHRPAIVISLREDFGKGSVRSYGGRDVLEGLRRSASTLLGFGGHKHAAGLTVALDRWEEFARAFDVAMGELTPENEVVPLLIEGECGLEEMDLKTLLEIEKLGPFGPGNPEPVFSFQARVSGHRVLKGRHLKLNLSPVGATSAKKSRPVDAIFFHAAEDDSILKQMEDSIETFWAAVPEVNRFRGQIAPSLRVRDFRWRKNPSQ